MVHCSVKSIFTKIDYCDSVRSMDVRLLEDIGLSEAQARAYAALVESGTGGAPAVAAQIGESRTNAYKVLDKLCELGLATKNQHGKRVRYFPSSPAALEQLIKKRAEQVSLEERKLKAAMPGLLDHFFAHSEQPGIRFFHGREGILQIYQDQIKSGQPIYYVRSRDDIKFLSVDDLHVIRNKLAKLGIKRRAIIQDQPARASIPEHERTPIAESDKAMLLTRIWINVEDYDEPVEWAVYGNKLAIISFGEEAIGMIIESPQIAQAFRQMYGLLEEGIRQRPGYEHRPLHLKYTAMPDLLRAKQNDSNSTTTTQARQ